MFENDSKHETLRVAGIVRESFVDGPGIRFTIFCQGCPHLCKNCHNPETHDFSSGYDLSNDKIVQEIKKDLLLSGVTFSGGEPFCQAEGFYDLAVKIKKLGTGLDILIFTGYTYEELIELSEKDKAVGKLLGQADFLVDGRYIDEQKDLTLRFRGSRNQRYIDLKETFEKGHIVTLR